MSTVVWFGAGASKACGLLLTSELIPALYNPEAHGVDLRRSQYDEVRAAFRRRRGRAIPFLDYVGRNRLTDGELLTEAFSVLAEGEESLKGIGQFTHIDIADIKRALFDALRTLLNPAYSVFFDPTPYVNFVRWAQSQPYWITILTTNWDQIIDEVVTTAYFYDTIDMGMDESPVDELIPHAMLMELQRGRFCSLYKFNGSVNWLYCPADQRFYGTGFQPPYNLEAMVADQELRAIKRLLGKGTGNALTERSGHCPNCGTPLETRLYVPGVSRESFPKARRLHENAMHAIRHCRNLFFVGFSCPPEDRDTIADAGNAIRENERFRHGHAKVTVIQNPGPHADATKSRYEAYLECEVDYRDSGFIEWVTTLSACGLDG